MYSTEGTYFFLLNEGNAVNFLHNAVVGDFIFLVQAEIVLASRRLIEEAIPADRVISEVSPSDRAEIASAWLRYFS